MIKLALVFFLVLFQQPSFGAVYKCEQNGGKVEYQANPCVNGRVVSNIAKPLSSATASTSDAKPEENNKKCAGKEIRINFANMSLKSTLAVIADFSGNKLEVEPSVSGSSAFSYECVPWDTVLQDIASKHNLIISVENGTIVARKR